MTRHRRWFIPNFSANRDLPLVPGVVNDHIQHLYFKVLLRRYDITSLSAEWVDKSFVCVNIEWSLTIVICEITWMWLSKETYLFCYFNFGNYQSLWTLFIIIWTSKMDQFGIMSWNLYKIRHNNNKYPVLNEDYILKLIFQGNGRKQWL